MTENVGNSKERPGVASSGVLDQEGSIPSPYSSVCILEVTMAHQRYWSFQFLFAGEEFLKSQANLAVLEILRTTPESELWITEYDDSLPSDDEGHMKEWIATPSDFDYRVLGNSNELRRWRSLV
tara:strand:+ start:1318 stop:1689 length:372 start_codon:yes stop_codon:yes gene_type:complete